MKLNGGFSLIELMLVLTIAAILSVISVTGFKFFWQKTQADVLSSQLMTAIHLARSEAIARQDKIILCGSTDQVTCSDQWQTGYIITTVDHVIYHFQNVSQAGILHWRSFPRNKQRLEFSAKNYPYSQNGTFWFCQPDAVNPVWAIVMNKSSRVRIAYPDKEGKIRDDKGVIFVC